MQHRVTSIIAHLAKSHREMARVLEAKRHSIVNLARIVTAIPSDNVSFSDISAIQNNAMELTKSVTAYLNSLADFEESIASNLELVIQELSEYEEEE